MGFNGSGVYQRVRNWVADATAGIKIRADYHDAEDDGFAAGLSNCVTKDGQTVITQNIPFNSKRITGLADPIDPQDAATKASVAALTSDKFPTTGGTISGALTVTGLITASAGITANSDVTSNRAGGVTGYFFAGNSGGVYYGFDGTNMQIQGAPLTVGGAVSMSSNLNVAGSAGVAGSVSANVLISGAHMTVGNGVLYMRADNGAYFQWSADHYNAPQGPIYASNGRLWGASDFAGLPSPGATASRLVFYVDYQITTSGGPYEPVGGGVVSSMWFNTAYYVGRIRYLQLLINGSWATAGYA